MTWTQEARQRVWAHLPRYRLESAPWVTDEALVKAIRREQYPWGERRMWPYKAWLKGCADILFYLRTGSWRRRCKAVTPLEQTSLDLRVPNGERVLPTGCYAGAGGSATSPA